MEGLGLAVAMEGLAAAQQDLYLWGARAVESLQQGLPGLGNHVPSNLSSWLELLVSSPVAPPAQGRPCCPSPPGAPRDSSSTSLSSWASATTGASASSPPSSSPSGGTW